MIDRTRAWELLNDPDHMSRLTVVGLQILMVQAGYPPEAVQDAINEHGLARLGNDMVM